MRDVERVVDLAQTVSELTEKVLVVFLPFPIEVPLVIPKLAEASMILNALTDSLDDAVYDLLSYLFQDKEALAL